MGLVFIDITMACDLFWLFSLDDQIHIYEWYLMTYDLNI